MRPPPNNLDTRRRVSIIIGGYGEDALIHAAMRHGELLDKGDVDGAMVWGRVVRVIRELLLEVVPEGKTVH